MTKIIANLLIILGVSLFAFLGYEHYTAKQEQKRMIAQIEQLQESALTAPNNGTDAGTPQGVLQLEIPKIGVDYPILEGTTDDILRVAVGHLKESGQLGEVGQNFVVLGHRNYMTGKYFSRLDELASGDRFTIFSKTKTYTYKVIGKKVILPTNIEALEPITGKSLVTLVTCHPKFSSKKRLLIFSELVSSKSR